ncbi:unnamed protein product [Arctia plantaginis]|uniref:Uncharacterized protein n=1 Tax=Arctia plantaginis TaxID=874455 RepID=A0A8S0ZK59_ARCPL|nr:unnamed protein product [Arctia plantaginis]
MRGLFDSTNERAVLELALQSQLCLTTTMLMQLLVTAALAAGLAPCVLQRACPSRHRRPPSTVCMHRVKRAEGCFSSNSIEN